MACSDPEYLESSHWDQREFLDKDSYPLTSPWRKARIFPLSRINHRTYKRTLSQRDQAKSYQIERWSSS